MRAIKHRVQVESPTQDKIRIYSLGDIHWGAPGCAETKLRKTVKEIRDDPNALWIGMGDYIDCITHNDRRRFNPKHFEGTRYTIAELADLPKIQATEILAELEPIKDKCIGLVEGNHEWVNPKYNAVDVMSIIVAGIGAPMLGPCALIRLIVGDATNKRRYAVTIWCHHGYGGGRLAGGDALALQRLIGAAQADIYFFGHRHKQMVLPDCSLFMDEGDPPRIRHLPRVGGMTGSYLKSYVQDHSDYVEEAGLPPTILGSPYVDIWSEYLHGEPNEPRPGYVPVFQMMHPPLSQAPI